MEAAEQEQPPPEAALPARRQKRHPCSSEGKFVKGCKELKIFAGRGHPSLAAEVAAVLGSKPGEAIISTFADGESQVQVQESVRGLDVYIFQR